MRFSIHSRKIFFVRFEIFRPGFNDVQSNYRWFESRHEGHDESILQHLAVHKHLYIGAAAMGYLGRNCTDQYRGCDVSITLEIEHRDEPKINSLQESSTQTQMLENADETTSNHIDTADDTAEIPDA